MWIGRVADMTAEHVLKKYTQSVDSGWWELRSSQLVEESALILKQLLAQQFLCPGEISVIQPETES